MAFIESLKELKDVDFADLDIQQIGVWPAALKAILLLTVLLVILALGLFFQSAGCQPTNTNCRAARSRVIARV